MSEDRRSLEQRLWAIDAADDTPEGGAAAWELIHFEALPAILSLLDAAGKVAEAHSEMEAALRRFTALRGFTELEP